jgi:peptidoglycan/LPS O-acetylase OafA/YrhL
MASWAMAACSVQTSFIVAILSFRLIEREFRSGPLRYNRQKRLPIQ